MKRFSSGLRVPWVVHSLAESSVTYPTLPYMEMGGAAMNRSNTSLR